MDEALIDTDILSEVLKGKDARVLANLQLYLTQHSRLAFSAITFYEIVRGLVVTGASQQLTRFLQMAGNSEIVPVSLSILRRMADLWAAANIGGFPRNDADLIIAASALEVGRVLVTGNTSHFAWIQGLRLDNWRNP
jgi:tRNA(fMet)-specific endonuclease VapC